MNIKFKTKAHSKIWRFLCLIRDEMIITDSSDIQLPNDYLTENKLSCFEAAHFSRQLKKQKLIKAETICKGMYATGAWNVQGIKITVINEIKFNKYMKNFQIKHANKSTQPKNNKKIELALYSDNYLCPKNTTHNDNCYLFRNRKGKPPKRIEILNQLIKNSMGYMSSAEIAIKTKQESSTVSKEIKGMFISIAKKLEVDTGRLLQSNDNGYRLTCDIKIKDRNLT